MRVHIWCDGAAMPNDGPTGQGTSSWRRAPARLGSARRRDEQRCRVHGGSERAAGRGRRGRDVGSRADGLAGGLRPPLWGIACAGRAPDPAQGRGRSAGGPISGAGHVRSDSQGAERSCRRAREGRRPGLEGVERRSAAIGSASSARPSARFGRGSTRAVTLARAPLPYPRSAGPVSTASADRSRFTTGCQ
jgi:hypothetical protein